jgi:pyruvate dehydrogenase E1 component alpha subunit
VETEASFLSGKYREEDEIVTWRGRDPITRLRAHLLASGTTERQIEEVHARIEQTVEDACSRALADPLPAEELAFRHMLD